MKFYTSLFLDPLQSAKVAVLTTDISYTLFAHYEIYILLFVWWIVWCKLSHDKQIKIQEDFFKQISNLL